MINISVLNRTKFQLEFFNLFNSLQLDYIDEGVAMIKKGIYKFYLVSGDPEWWERKHERERLMACRPTRL